MKNGRMGAWLVLAGLLATMSLAATAAGPDDRPGFYLGVAVGRISSDKYHNIDRDNAVAYTLGYRFDAQVSGELVAQGFGMTAWVGTLFDKNYAYPESHLSLAVRVQQPLSEATKGWLRAGVGMTHFERGPASSHGARQAEASVGAGLGYDFGPIFGVRLELNRYLRSQVNALTLGGEWRF